MQALIQLDLFRETTTEDILKARVDALEASHHAVRKKAFAEIRGLTKIVLDQQEQIDYLKVKLNLACPIERPQLKS